MIQEILKKQKKEFIIIGSSVAGLVLILVISFVWAKSANGEIEKEEEVVPAPVVEVVNPFEEVRLTARAAIIKEVATGKILYEKNPDEALPLASLTKVVTAITALDILSEDDLVRVHSSDLVSGNDSGFVIGSYFRLKDMLNVSLVSSSNGAAQAIAVAGGEKIALAPGEALISFVDRMNAVASRIGMEKTNFKNPTGLDEENETVASATGSARDISRLFEYVLKNEPQIFEATREDYVVIKSREGYEHKVINTNKIVGDLPNIIGSKTGYTDLAGGNLAVVIDPGLNTPVVIVVLGSSKEGRFKDVERLSKATLDYFLLKQ
ncbi:MAG: D-alanyl-D-alanine carboxypeptidase [Candidatus Paceibacterota bacterium]